MYWYKRALDFKKREKVPQKKKKSLLKNARSKCLRYQIIKKSAEIETLNTLKRIKRRTYICDF